MRWFDYLKKCCKATLELLLRAEITTLFVCCTNYGTVKARMTNTIISAGLFTKNLSEAYYWDNSGNYFICLFRETLDLICSFYQSKSNTESWADKPNQTINKQNTFCRTTTIMWPWDAKRCERAMWFHKHC